MKRIVPILLLVAALGCTPPSHRVGSAGPPPGRIIPVGFDPSVSGLSGAVGEVVYTSGGVGAWVRFGTNDTDWRPSPGATGLSTVTTDSTLSGAGTAGSPLGVAVTAGMLGVYVATVDYMTTGFYSFNAPQVAGKRFIIVGAARSEIITRNASLTTGPTLFIAQNGVDISSSFALPTATANGTSPPMSVNSSITNTADPDMTSLPLQAHVSIAAAGTGLTTCTGLIFVPGIYR